MTRAHTLLACPFFTLLGCGAPIGAPWDMAKDPVEAGAADAAEAPDVLSVLETGAEAATEGGHTDATSPGDASGDAEAPEAASNPWAPCQAWPDAMEGGDIYWACPKSLVQIPVLCPGTKNLLIAAGCYFIRTTIDLAGNQVTELCCPEKT